MTALGMATIFCLVAAVVLLSVSCLRLRREAKDTAAMMGLMRGALENTQAYIYIKDRQHKFVYANPMTLRYFNVTAEKLVGSVDTDHFPAEAAATIYAQDEGVMSGGPALKEELTVGDDPATRVVFLDTKQALRDPSGEISAVVGIATDITETVRLRDELNVAMGRLEAELETARQLQFGMLSNRLLLVSEPQPVDIHALMEPAREVGGDLYDVFYTDDGLLCMVIGDVCGKGAASGMFMARTLSLVRMAVTELRPQMGAEHCSPGRILGVVNRQLCRHNDDCMFVTLFIGFLDPRTGEFTYANAGHPLPYRLSAGQGIALLDGAKSPPLAVMDDMEFGDSTAHIEDGEGLFAYTDGVDEAMDGSGAFFTRARLEGELVNYVGAGPEALIRHIKQQVDHFVGGAPKADDVTMVALRRGKPLQA